MDTIIAFQSWETSSLGLYRVSIWFEAIILEYILLGSLEYIFFHGVRIDVPNEKDNPIEKKQLQIMYHKYVSKKNNIKSVKIIRNNVIFGCKKQIILAGTNQSPLQRDISNTDKIFIGSLKERVKKK